MRIPITFLGAAVLGFATAATAQPYTVDEPVQVIERNKAGKATKVVVDGVVYDVCMSDRQDDCINPRAAKLGFGDFPLSYWPGSTKSDAS